MPNQYSTLTRANILRKINRKRNPVRNMVQLAQEFGQPTSYLRWSGVATEGYTGSAAPASFRRKVKALVGETTYNKIRDERYVNHSYR